MSMEAEDAHVSAKVLQTGPAWGALAAGRARPYHEALAACLLVSANLMTEDSWQDQISMPLLPHLGIGSADSAMRHLEDDFLGLGLRCGEVFRRYAADGLEQQCFHRRIVRSAQDSLGRFRSRSISRASSFLFRLSRLSYCFFPRARPSSTLALPLLK